jgi:hypothetical protein
MKLHCGAEWILFVPVAVMAAGAVVVIAAIALIDELVSE